jgi:Xaa-Pro aminopeptidase
MPSPFDLSERDARLQRIWRRMHEEGIAALVLTSEPNFRYVADFRSPTWVSVTRPRYAVVPLDGLPMLIVPESNRVLAGASGWAGEVRTWQAPRPADDGVSLLADALAERAPAGRIAFEIGSGSRLGFAAVDFLRLVDGVGRGRLADAGALMHAVRGVKSRGEQARHRLAAGMTSRVLNRLPALAAGMATDRALHRRTQVALLGEGLERVPYLVCAAAPGGYVATNTEPEDRPFRAGDVVYVDAGATVDGAFADLNRNVAIGVADAATQDAYRIVRRALDAGVAAVRPGAPVSALWRAMAAVLDHEGGRSGIGRLGHGVGLELTEPPSIAPDSDVRLAPGMIIAVEPSLAYAPVGDGAAPRLMVLEENVLVTEEGAELLSEPAPYEIPVI